jgi:apolipoprotein N-acyltransferase
VAFVGVLVLAWILLCAKIVTAPIPPFVALGFGLPIGLLFSAAYLAWHALRKRSPGSSALAFAALMVLAEWAQHGLSPLATWGAVAYTQSEHLALMQLASVTGLHGVSALVYFFAAVLEEGLANGWSPVRRRLMIAAAVVGGVIAFGQARLAVATGQATQTVLVAAVGTDSDLSGPPLPTAEEMAQVDARIWARTRTAAAAGAKLVVWTEASTLVYADDEATWTEGVGDLANEIGVPIVAAYVVPTSNDPFGYENKYIYVGPDGSVEHTYFKHHPVPGEPAVPGTGPTPKVVSPELGNVSGAICYDYDFPRLALRQARAGIDIVALPSSDWRGIDPIHTQMAAVRAIEGGHSIVRSTRWGLSAGIDPYGRIRGWLSHFDDDERILLVNVPRHGIWTFYGVAGDWFPGACLLLLAGIVVVSVRRHFRQTRR